MKNSKCMYACIVLEPSITGGASKAADGWSHTNDRAMCPCLLLPRVSCRTTSSEYSPRSPGRHRVSPPSSEAEGEAAVRHRSAVTGRCVLQRQAPPAALSARERRR
ncbi:hypothetical protein BRADI_1g10731v3 [Brachypodium distachyon]|uniref:Uncharacterized protein n=1 Tax=Brachypodium distachyon TaxID=15368 RepID=A0A0Q3GRP2_BRADI|nr:hypothetical protein BRADI_1g10731v3 [Brachypodium distachyon]